MDARTDDRGGLGRRNRPRKTPKGRQVDPSEGRRQAEGQLGRADQSERGNRNLSCPALAVPEPDRQHKQTEPAGDAENVQGKDREAGAQMASGQRDLGELGADRDEARDRGRHRRWTTSPSL